MCRINYILRYIFMVMLAISLLGGCSGTGWFDTPEIPNSVAELMAQGEELYNEGSYMEAGMIFQRVKDRFPYSSYATVAELRLADGYYERRQFEDAYAGYDDFERLHPKNEKIPYVMYKKGMCEFEQITALDREQNHVIMAREEFERLIRRFPEDVYADKARKKLRQCLTYLSEYELSVGHFYFKMGQYDAALKRYTYLIENYPDMGSYHEALEYIRKCNEQLDPENFPTQEESGILDKLWPF